MSSGLDIPSSSPIPILTWSCSRISRSLRWPFVPRVLIATNHSAFRSARCIAVRVDSYNNLALEFSPSMLSCDRISIRGHLRRRLQRPLGSDIRRNGFERQIHGLLRSVHLDQVRDGIRARILKLPRPQAYYLLTDVQRVGDLG